MYSSLNLRSSPKTPKKLIDEEKKSLPDLLILHSSSTDALPSLPFSPSTVPSTALVPSSPACGRLFSPAAARITTRIVYKCIPYGKSSEEAVHSTIGKLCHRDGGGVYRVGEVLRVSGHRLLPPPPPRSPRQRSTPLPVSSVADRHVIVREDSPTGAVSFPAWATQLRDIASRAKTDEEKVAEGLGGEWLEWGRKAIEEYLSCSPSQTIASWHVAGEGRRPPWRGLLPPLSSSLSLHLRIMEQIRSDFFCVWRPLLLFDADDFFHSETARDSAAFALQLRQFVDEAKDVIQCRWPLHIGRLLLKESSLWVAQLSEEGGAKSFLDGVAATQATLLVDVIKENLERIGYWMEADSRNAALLLLMDDESEELGREEILMEMASFPRVDGKINPKLFGRPWVDVSQWIGVEGKEHPTVPTPFKDIGEELERIEKEMEEWKEREDEGREEEERDEWHRILKRIEEVENKMRNILPRYREGTTLFNCSRVKEKMIRRGKEMKEKAREEMMERQQRKYDEEVFSVASTKIFGKGIIEQLSQVSEVEAVLPSLERGVACAVSTFFIAIDFFSLPDSIVRHCYEISRLGTKLRQLIAFVWRRIDLEKEWVSKSVSDESHALFFESELLEKEVESCLHKYRNCHSISQVQRVASRLDDIAARANRLNEKVELMRIQRRLLQMEEMCAEVPALAKQTRLIATLGKLHYDTLSTEENFLSMRVFDVDKDDVIAAHAALSEAFEAFVPSIAEIERESALSLSQVAVSSIQTSLGKLRHLIPILAAMSNRNMRSHHWQMLMATDGSELEENPPVAALLDFNFVDKAQAFEEVAVIADKETVVEKSMQGMKNELAATKLQPKAPVDDWLDLRSRLGTQAARCRTLLASLPPADMAVQLREWMETVEGLAGFVDFYVKCSRSWTHVEGVFATDDIAYQMPSEFWTFTRIRQLWQQLNQAIADQPILSYVVKVQQLSSSLSHLLSLFGNVEAGFNSYVAKKRTAFPRLHVLSHGELLDLLSQSRDPASLSSFIHFLFTRVHSFVMNGRGEVTHMRSVHHELYALSHVVHASIYKHHAEKWLAELERESAKSMRDQLRNAIESHKLSLIAVLKMEEVPEQIVEVFVLVSSTHLMEKAIKMNAIKKFVEYLEKAIREIAKGLTERRRPLTEKICSILIRRQGLARHLLVRGTKLTDDEMWIKELRWYWNNDHVFVRLFRTVVRFDYEMLGSSRGLRGMGEVVKAAIRAAADSMALTVRDEEGTLEEVVAEVATALGRPLILPRTMNKDEQSWRGSGEETPAERRRALVKAALLVGGVALVDVDEMDEETMQELLCILYEMRKEYSANEQLRVQMDEADLVVSRSAVFIFRTTICPTSRRSLNFLDSRGRCVVLREGGMEEVVAELMRSHGGEDCEKIAQQVCITVTILREVGGRKEKEEGETVEVLSWRPHYAPLRTWIENAARVLARLWSDPSVRGKERDSLLGRALHSSLLPSLSLEDRLLLTSLLPSCSGSALDRPHRLLLSGLSAHSGHAPFVAKCMEVISALLSIPILILLGPPLGGKSLLIEAARAAMEAEKEISIDVYNFHSDSTAFESFARAKMKQSSLSPTEPSEKGEAWLILDASPSLSTLQWLSLLLSLNTADSLPPSVRVVVETDVLMASTSLPLVYVDTDTVPLPSLSPSVVSLLTSLGVIDQRVLYSVRRSLLEGALSSPPSPLLESLINVIILQSLRGFDCVVDNFKQLNSPVSFDVLLRRSSFPGESMLSSEGDSSLLFLSHLVLLLLNARLLPVLSSSPVHVEAVHTLQFTLQKSFSLFEVFLSSSSSVSDLRGAIHACQLLTGEEEGVLGEAEGAPLLLIHSSSPLLLLDIQECIRSSAYERRSNLRILLLSTSSPMVPVWGASPPRMEGLSFPIDVSIAFPCNDPQDTAMEGVYRKLMGDLKGETRKEGARQWRRALGEYSHCTPYSRAMEYLEREGGEEEEGDRALLPSTVVRDGHIRPLQEVMEELSRASSDLPDPLLLSHSTTSSVCLLESCLSSSSHSIFIGSRGSGRRQTLRLAAHLTHFSVEYVGAKTTKDDWEALMEKTLGACILDGARVVVYVGEFPPDESVQSLIHSDVVAFVARKVLPARLLSHALLCQVSDKYSVGGSFLWPEMRSRLRDSLVFVLAVESTDAAEFVECHPESLSHFALVSSPVADSSSLRQSARALLLDCRLFTSEKMETMLDALCTTQKILVEERLTGMDAKFIEFVRTFVLLVREKKEKVDVVAKRFERGMEKLRKAEEQVAFLQGELLRLQPELVRTSMETSMLMSSIERESIEVENAREVVAANEYAANEAATGAQALKVESEEDLANALPALEAAVDALQTMKQSDISTLKTMRYPPQGVRMCMEAVCILLGQAPSRIPNPMSGEATLDYWPTGQKLLSDIHFLARIRSFPRDSVPKKTITLIRDKYLSMEEFDPEKVKQCSLAAEGLCLWVKAVDLYSRIAGVVQPKKEKLRRAEVLVKQHMKQLEVKRKALQKVTEKLQGLSDHFSQMSQKKQELQSKIHGCEIRMERAERLVTALGGEKQKWAAKMESVRREAEEVPWLSLGHSAALEFLSLQPLSVRERVMARVREGMRGRVAIHDVAYDHSILKNATKTVFIVDMEEETATLCQRALGGNGYDRVDMGAGEEAVWESIRRSAESGRPLLIRHVDFSSALRESLLFVKESGQFVTINGVECPAKNGFRLIFSGEGPVEKTAMATLTETGVVFLLSSTVASIEERVRAVILGRNCADLVGRRDGLRCQEEGTREQLAALEEAMLDLLARSQDLDDEKAIELLQQSKQLHEANETAATELRTVGRLLGRLEEALAPVFEWAGKAISMCRSLSSLSPWYNFSPRYLVSIIDVCLVELPPDEAVEVEMFDVAMMQEKICHLLWSELSPSLLPDHRFLLQDALGRVLPSPSLDSFRSLHSRLSLPSPLILLLPPQSAGFIDSLSECRSGRGLSSPLTIHTSLGAGLPQLVRSHREEGVWVVVSSTQFDSARHSIDALVEELERAENVHSGFRLIFVVSMEQPLRRWVEGTRSLVVHRASSFSAFIQSVVSSPPFVSSLSSLTVGQEGRLVSLIALHFSLVTRSSFGESVAASSETPSPSRLFHSVVHPVYGAAMEDEADEKVLSTLFEWLFVGLNKQDDSIPSSFLHVGEATEKHEIYKNPPGEGIEICGLSPILLSQVKEGRQRKRKIDLERVKRGESAPSAPPTSRSVPPPTFRSGQSTGRQMTVAERRGQGRGVANCCHARSPKADVSNYLLNELESCGEGEGDRSSYILTLLSRLSSSPRPLLRLDVSRLLNPSALLCTLRAMASDQSRTSLSDVVVEGELFPMTSSSLPRPPSFPSSILIVWLLNARLDSAGLRECGISSPPPSTPPLRPLESETPPPSGRSAPSSGRGRGYYSHSPRSPSRAAWPVSSPHARFSPQYHSPQPLDPSWGQTPHSRSFLHGRC